MNRTVGQRVSRILVGCLVSGTFSSEGLAVAPPCVSDHELAAFPIIVVAKWTKAPLKADRRKDRLEAHTEILVTRVIRGPLQPGRNAIVLGHRIGWYETGGPVMSFTSSERRGDVEDVREEQLWFLTADPASTKLCLNTHRGVQPKVLEPYFRALAAPTDEKDLLPLLSHEQPIVLARVLQQLAGGVMPWPFEPVDADCHKSPPLKQHAEMVLPLLQHQNAEVRAMAAAVYAKLAGKKAGSAIRKLLFDSDLQVRATAVGILIQQRDKDPDLTAAVRSISDVSLASELIALLGEWEDVDAATPLLIEFLQTEGGAAVHAQQVLAKLLRPEGPVLPKKDLAVDPFRDPPTTSVVRPTDAFIFPYDVAASRQAWDAVKALADPEERIQRLQELAPSDPDPWRAALVQEKEALWIEITNRSRQARTLSATIDSVSCQGAGGSNYSGGLKIAEVVPASVKGFVTVMPGAKVRFRLDAESSLLRELSGPLVQEITLQFGRTGKAQGVKAWVGAIQVAPLP